MSTEDVIPNQPAWAVTCEPRDDGRTVFRDEHGEPLAALALTRDDLTQLESGLRSLPESQSTAGLLDRLAALYADLDESAE